MAVIGIDLGTTNSLAAIWRKGKSELIPNAVGEFLTPSVISVDDNGEILVGKAALDRLITHPHCTAACFKRDMGTDKQYDLNGQCFTPEELSSFVLRRLREDAESFLHEPVTEAVVSVPAYFSEAQRTATKRAGELAGLTVERLVNEPSAAAVAGHIGEGDVDKTCLVFDFGGGTLDVSLVERFDTVVSITAVSGDNQLGGHDFDTAIARGFCQDCGFDYDTLNTKQQALLLRQAESCKIALTMREPVLMAVTGEITASLSLTNEWVIRKSSALFKRLSAPVRRVLVDAHLTARDLDELILVGGSSHMPTVRQFITKLLQHTPTPQTQPDTAIALGAGICAGMKTRAPDLCELVLTDVCPFSLGVGTHNDSDPERLLMSPIIERNSVLPSSKEGVYVTVRDNQTLIDLKIFQGENLYCNENIALGRLSIHVPPAPRGVQQVRVRFTYDINGLLEVEATSTDGQCERLLLQNGNMSEQEIQQRLQLLARLKLHPRERERNRILLARADRLFQTTTGSCREQIMAWVKWFEMQLATQEPMRIARAAKHFAKLLDNIEMLDDVFDVPPVDYDPFADEGE